MKKIQILVFSLFALILSSCSSTNNENSQTQDDENKIAYKDNNSKDEDENKIVYKDTNTKEDNEYKKVFTDSDPIEDDKIKLEFNKPNCFGMENCTLTVSVNITNKEYETRTYNIKNVELIKESTSAKYTVNYAKSNVVEAEMKYSLSFSANIPTDIKTDKYKLTFSFDSFNITYYLYETPDEYRVDRTVKYHILNNVVKTALVKDGRTINDSFVYDSPDNLYYCDTWYLDSNYKTKLTTSTIIKEDTNLYGIQSANIKWTTFSSDAWSFVNGINHVPSNGVLILPEKYYDKEIAIGNYAIRNISVSKIYIPKTVHKIYGGNFAGIGNATIYYEGSEAEWKALFNMQSDIVTKNMVYNTKAPK